MVQESRQPSYIEGALAAGKGGARRIRLVASAVAAAGLIAAAWPVTTAVGENHHVTLKPLTLFEKSVAFIDRDLAMRRLTREIAGPGGTQQERLLRMYAWVGENIHEVPPGLPTVDDHVWHIFVRRYGAIDQRAEALAALATYDGMPASTIQLGESPHRRIVQLTVVSLGDRNVVFDVNNRIVFRRSTGELATLGELQENPGLIDANSGGLMVDGVPYRSHFSRLKDSRPDFSRMQKQRLLPRVKAELIDRLHGS